MKYTTRSVQAINTQEPAATLRHAMEQKVETFLHKMSLTIDKIFTSVTTIRWEGIQSRLRFFDTHKNVDF